VSEPRHTTVASPSRLAAALTGLGRVCVSFSGGVDSSLVLAVAARSLGADQVVAFTAVSDIRAPAEVEAARRLAAELGVEHVVVETDELRLDAFRRNPRDRCYHCKAHLLDHMARVAHERGCATLVDGANIDDLADDRPGMRAADERGAAHPLVDAGFRKEDVRRLARELGLRNWDAPAEACLASRIPYGDTITAEKLRVVAAAEAALRELGFRPCRVRHHGVLARVEVEVAEVARAAGAARKDVARRLRALGFAYVTLDLDGFRSGSMNEAPSGAPRARETTS
jgi:pyridinium-3,5-biscarboxylic acid mononucleotide sulfurtransferase